MVARHGGIQVPSLDGTDSRVHSQDLELLRLHLRAMSLLRQCSSKIHMATKMVTEKSTIKLSRPTNPYLICPKPSAGKGHRYPYKARSKTSSNGNVHMKWIYLIVLGEFTMIEQETLMDRLDENSLKCTVDQLPR